MATQPEYVPTQVTSSSLVPVSAYQPPRVQGFLMPLGKTEEARAAVAAYEELKTAIVRPDDIQRIQGRDFLKKSFWRRIAACFGLSLELVNEERLIIDGKLAYRASYRAIAPNGRVMDGDGMCSTAEKGRADWPEHNVRATAHTRAKNRAISDLVGGGEVSAEEMPDEEIAERERAYDEKANPAKPRWNAMEDKEVKRLFKEMRRDEAQSRTLLTNLYKQMRVNVQDWTRENVLKELREIKAELEGTVTEVSLEDLDVGERGN